MQVLARDVLACYNAQDVQYAHFCWFAFYLYRMYSIRSWCCTKKLHPIEELLRIHQGVYSIIDVYIIMSVIIQCRHIWTSDAQVRAELGKGNCSCTLTYINILTCTQTHIHYRSWQRAIHCTDGVAGQSQSLVDVGHRIGCTVHRVPFWGCSRS